MPKITTHLWFDQEAKEAAKFYTSIFPDSKIKSSSVLHDTPSGSVDILTIDLMGEEFTLISAGPLFKFNPSVSFTVSCKTTAEVEKYWRKLAPGGKILMELGSYPFSEKYGWLQDKYGLSWQIIFVKGQPITQRIIPAIMFVGKNCGRAEEAINYYVSLFRDAKVGELFRYAEGQEPDQKGTIAHGTFQLEGQKFIVMDSARKHDFEFNEAISFLIHCANQKEIDYYWQLSADPKAEQCGWLKDRYGLSWQVVPNAMDIMMQSQDRKKIDRVTKAFLKMKKFDLAKLEAAYQGK